MAVDDPTRIKKHAKKHQREHKDAAIDETSEIDRANKKRKAEVLEGDGNGDFEALTKKERKTLRKLAKEAENAAILQEDGDKRQEKKESKRNTKQQVRRLPPQAHELNVATCRNHKNPKSRI